MKKIMICLMLVGGFLFSMENQIARRNGSSVLHGCSVDKEVGLPKVPSKEELLLRKYERRDDKQKEVQNQYQERLKKGDPLGGYISKIATCCPPFLWIVAISAFHKFMVLK